MKKIALSRLTGNRLSFAVAIAATSLGATHTMAQEAQEGIQEIQVTGSFITRPASRPQPVSVMDQEDLQIEQRMTMTEIMRNMPQVSSANTDSIFLNPTNTINLRGLGSRSTLILLNGQRQTIDANSGSTVDINNLAPTIMVERMELVLDGASALYGSDAVAGVANFITRNGFDGAEVQISTQVAEAQSSIPEVTLSGIFGSQGPETGVVLGIEWQYRGEAMNSEDVETKERLETGLPSAFGNPGTFGANGAFYKDPLCDSELIGGQPGNDPSDPAGYTDNSPFCRSLSTLARSFIPENERLTGMAVVTHQLDHDWVDQFQVEMNMATTEYISDYGSGGPLLSLPSYNAILPAHNPGVIDANERDPSFPVTDFDTIYTRQISPLETAAVHTSSQDTFRTAVTFNGTFGTPRWDWQLAGTYSRNEQYTQDVDTIATRYAAALQGYGGPDCKWNTVLGVEDDPNGLQAGVGPCQYWNPFASRMLAEEGDPTYNSQELLDWMQYGSVNMGESRLYTLEGIVTGELWEMAGGTTGVAFGTQFRKQLLEIEVDPIAKDGGFGFDPQVLTDWDSNRQTEAVFGEIVMFPSESLEVDLAARYEDTEGTSSVEPKISALWTPNDRLFIRASAGSSFRMPTENQLQGIGSGAKSFIELGGEPPFAAGLSVGNPDLEPEESDNWTIGFTWDLNDYLTLEATYWDYEFSNLVTTTDPEDVLRQDIQDGYVDNMEAHPLFPGRPNEVCEITGRWDPESGQPLPAGCVTGLDIKIFNSSYINQNVMETNGIDFVVDYTDEMFGGEAGLQFNGSYVLKYAGIDSDTGELRDVAGTDGSGVAGVGANPELRANLMASYRNGNHTARATVRYIAGTERTNPNEALAGYGEGSFSTVDLTYTYSFSTEGPSSISLAVINAGDQLPPLTPNTLWTINRGLYDGRGRMFRASLNYGF